MDAKNEDKPRIETAKGREIAPRETFKILVDADACPVKEIVVRMARRHSIPVVMLIDTSHELHDGYSTVITVDTMRDGVDFALVSRVEPGDVVVTQDYGLAAMVLGKRGRAINQNGLVYSDDNIDGLLMSRHIGQKIRRAGGRTKGPAKRTEADDACFEEAFMRLIEASHPVA